MTILRAGRLMRRLNGLTPQAECPDSAGWKHRRIVNPIPPNKNQKNKKERRERNPVYKAETCSRSCSIKWLKKYLSMTELVSHPENYLLCRLVKTKRSHNVLGVHPITYQTVRKSFLENISFRDNNSNLGLHSLYFIAWKFRGFAVEAEKPRN